MATRGPDIQERLREGIEAARRGDRINARRLLQQVLIIDRDNEVALMWMASVVDSMSERRAFLERALRLNPNNTRAREALKRMGAAVGPAPAGAPPATGVPRAGTASARGGMNAYLIAAGVIGVITLVVVLLALRNQPNSNGAGASTPSTDDVARQTLNAFMSNAAASAPTDTPISVAMLSAEPTETPFFGVIVTIDPNAQYTLPPTFTPTDTPQPSETPTATPTDVPPAAYQILYTMFSAGETNPGLYRVYADGHRNETLGNAQDGYFDPAYNRTSDMVAFVRPTVSDDNRPPRPQLYIAPLADLTQFSGLTNFNGTSLTDPAWSPDGQQIVFVTNQDGDNDLWIYDAGVAQSRQLTDNNAEDTAPSWSPDGDSIVFSSDMDSPGFSEIYAINVHNMQITRLSDEAGQNYDPVYSPDGTRIAFISTQGGDSDIYIMDADGQRKFLLTIDDNGAEDRTPRFTPDGAYIAFVSNRDGTFSPYLLNLRNDAVTSIIQTGTEVQSISVNPSLR